MRGAIWYCLLLLAIALWSAAYAWELAAPDFAQKLLALRIKYIGVFALPVVWIGFVLDFVARDRDTVRRVTRRMALVAAAMLLVAWTNPWHELFWGPLTLEPAGDLYTFTTTPPVSGATVLLVEDDPGVRAFASQVLRDAGSTVFEAANAAEALAIAARGSRPLDLLLTDVVLPGIDGGDLAAPLRALRPGLRVLFLSGYTPEEIAATAALAAEDLLLKKPFLPGALCERVAHVLRPRSRIGT